MFQALCRDVNRVLGAGDFGWRGRGTYGRIRAFGYGVSFDEDAGLPVSHQADRHQ